MNDLTFYTKHTYVGNVLLDSIFEPDVKAMGRGVLARATCRTLAGLASTHFLFSAHMLMASVTE